MFAEFFGITCETKILEACGWDEDRAEFLMNELSSVLEECAAQKKPVIVKETIDKLKSRLSTSASASEIDILVEIINDSIENIMFLLMNGDEEYEN